MNESILSSIYYNGELLKLPKPQSLSAYYYQSIPYRFRDHNDIDDGSLNFVSVIDRYFGWNVYNTPESPSVRSTVASGNNSIYTPTVLRLQSNDITIESFLSSNLSKNAGFRQPAYAVEATTPNSKYSTGFSWTNLISSENITVPPKSFLNMKRNIIIRSGLRESAYNGRHNGNTSIIAVMIDWDKMVDDAYIRYEVQPGKEPFESVRIAIVHSDKSDISSGGKFFGKADNITTLSLNGSAYTGGDIKTLAENKITNPNKRFTWIILEMKGNGDNDDFVSGLGFDVYFPERYYRDYVVGLDSKSFLYINNPDSGLGKLRNAIGILKKFTILPTFPRIGDQLKVIYNPDGREKSAKFKDYLCLYSHYDNDDRYVNNVLNPSKDIHIDSIRYFYPLPGFYNDEFVKDFLGDSNNKSPYYTRFIPLEQLGNV